MGDGLFAAQQCPLIQYSVEDMVAAVSAHGTAFRVALQPTIDHAELGALQSRDGGNGSRGGVHIFCRDPNVRRRQVQPHQFQTGPSSSNPQSAALPNRCPAIPGGSDWQPTAEQLQRADERISDAVIAKFMKWMQEKQEQQEQREQEHATD